MFASSAFGKFSSSRECEDLHQGFIAHEDFNVHFELLYSVIKKVDLSYKAHRLYMNKVFWV